MKQLMIITILFCGTLQTLFASEYEQVMAQNIQKMHEAQSSDELTAIANLFERIAATETDQWLPAYYQAYSYVAMLFINQNMPNNEKSLIIEKAQTILDNLKKSFANESEIFVLQGFLHQLSISSEATAYEYWVKAEEAFGIATKLNPDNPRVYYLRGMNTFHTPRQFGGGAEKAKPLLEKADSLFVNNKADNKLMPNWGKEHNAYMLAQCASE